MIKRGVPLLLLACGLVGCAGLRQFPEVATDHDAALATLDAHYAQALKDVYRSATPAQRKDIRNRMIETRMAVIDAYYKEFQAGLVKENVRTDFALSLVGIGVGGAGALVAGTASQILSAVSGGLAGGQAAYGKAVLYDKAMSALVAQMQASRKAIAAQIFERWNEDVDQYPMWMARTDVEAYYFAGSLPGAILATAADAKVKEKEAEDRLARFRSNVFSEDANAIAIRRFVRPPDGKPTDTVDQENVNKVREWIQKKSGVPDLPIASFLSNPELRVLRERAVREIPIP
jgi:hypothetical protein